MNGIPGWMTVGVLGAALTGVALAGAEALDQAAAETLLKGNTAEGTNVWKKQMVWYFGDFGELRKRDDRGNKGKAKWNINKKGEFCYQDKHMKQQACAPILPREDGGYDINLESKWKLDKVVPGNPHGL